MKTRRIKPPKGDNRYRQVWRIIDGAVLDCFKHHPEYLTENGKRAARESIVKRATGAIIGYEAQASWGRSTVTGGG